METSKIKDPKEQSRALEKFLRDYPASAMAAPARDAYVRAQVKLQPAKAYARCEKLAAGIPDFEAASLFRTLANALIDDPKQLPAAERAARHVLQLSTAGVASAEAKDEAERWKMDPPMASMIAYRATTRRSAAQVLLARVLEKRGNASEAQALYTDALQTNPREAGAATALAAIEEKAGHAEQALAYQAQALLIRATPEGKKAFAETWQKVKGSSAGLDAYLDARHKELFHNPVKVEFYKAPETRTSRVVLAEIYTGAGCPPCAGADMAFDVALERYARADVAVLMFHQHIPRPDPLANDDTIARFKWFGGRSVPTMMVDGMMVPGGGGDVSLVPAITKRLTEMLDERLQRAPSALLKLTAGNDGSKVQATIETRTLEQSANLKLHVALVEKELHYSGENGVRFHPMVVRAFATLPLTTNATQTFNLDEVRAALKKHIDEFEKHNDRFNKDGTYRFYERRQDIDVADLAVVAFIQNDKTREVLQAAWADVPRK